jgi:hypothetical protein
VTLGKSDDDREDGDVAALEHRHACDRCIGTAVERPPDTTVSRTLGRSASTPTQPSPPTRGVEISWIRREP